jgi:hypothetical protein
LIFAVLIGMTVNLLKEPEGRMRWKEMTKRDLIIVIFTGILVALTWPASLTFGHKQANQFCDWLYDVSNLKFKVSLGWVSVIIGAITSGYWIIQIPSVTQIHVTASKEALVAFMCAVVFGAISWAMFATDSHLYFVAEDVDDDSKER